LKDVTVSKKYEKQVRWEEKNMLPRHHNPSMQNLAQNVNAMEHERKRSGEETSAKKRAVGKIVFFGLLAVVVAFFVFVLVFK
jgi:hypothetical protein